MNFCRNCASRNLTNKGNGVYICWACGFENKFANVNLYTEEVVINSRQKIATHYLKEKKSKYEENISVLQTQDTINNNGEVKPQEQNENFNKNDTWIEFLVGYQDFLKLSARKIAKNLNISENLIVSVRKWFFIYLSQWKKVKTPVISSYFIKKNQKPEEKSKIEKNKQATNIKKSDLKRKRSKSFSNNAEEIKENTNIIHSENQLDFFFHSLVSNIKSMTTTSFETALQLYLKILKNNEKSIRIKREITLKALKIILKSKGITMDPPVFWLKKEIKSLKLLLFLTDFTNFTKKSRSSLIPEISCEKDPIPLSNLLFSFSKQSFFAENEDICKYLREKLSEMCLKIESNFENKDKMSPPPPLELNLILIFIYFGLIDCGYPILPKDMINWAKQGILLYFEGFSLNKKYIPTNLPSVAWLYKTIDKFYEFYSDELNSKLYEQKLLERVFKETEFPEIFEPLFNELYFILKTHDGNGKKFEISIFMCTAMILLMKLVYGLNGEAYCCLLKDEDFEFLEKSLDAQEKEMVLRIKDILKAFQNTDKWALYMREFPSLDLLIESLNKKILHSGANNCSISYLYQYEDLKTFRNKEDLALFLKEIREKSAINSQETQFDLDFNTFFANFEAKEKNKENSDGMQVFVKNETNHHKNHQNFNEKRKLNKFLKEEFEFLLKNCDVSHMKSLKETVLPLPSSHFVQRKDYDIWEENDEICVFLNYFSCFLQVDPYRLLSSMKKQEKMLIKIKS